jgi:hypothetical protein
MAHLQLTDVQGFCRKVRFLGQNPKIVLTGCKFSGAQTLLAVGNESDALRKMRGMLSQLVGLTCTSPPYFLARILLSHQPHNILFFRINSIIYRYCQNLQPVNS